MRQHQPGQRPELGGGAVDQSGGLVRLLQVGREEHDGPAQRADLLGEHVQVVLGPAEAEAVVVRVPVGQREVPAVGREPEREGGADAPAPTDAGDEGAPHRSVTWSAYSGCFSIHVLMNGHVTWTSTAGGQGLVERLLGERAADALALEGVVDLGVEQQPAAPVVDVLDEAGDDAGLVHRLVAVAGGVLLHGQAHAAEHYLSCPPRLG